MKYGLVAYGLAEIASAARAVRRERVLGRSFFRSNT